MLQQRRAGVCRPHPPRLRHCKRQRRQLHTDHRLHLDLPAAAAAAVAATLATLAAVAASPTTTVAIATTTIAAAALAACLRRWQPYLGPERV